MTDYVVVWMTTRYLGLEICIRSTQNHVPTFHLLNPINYSSIINKLYTIITIVKTFEVKFKLRVPLHFYLATWGKGIILMSSEFLNPFLPKLAFLTKVYLLRSTNNFFSILNNMLIVILYLSSLHPYQTPEK